MGDAAVERVSPVDRERRAEIADLLEQLAVLAVRQLGRRDISMTAASALGRLAREGPARLTALAADEGVSQPAMTQLVQRLTKQGLMARVADPDDGRAVLVSITDAGRRLLAERRRDRVARLSDLLAALPPEDQTTLAAAVDSAAPALRRLVAAATDLGGRSAPPAG
ncbi:MULTISPECIES: MarR family transcriptional regulator [Streptomyces]|uniref:MarR family transcriptional regulator n=1 Tax=Streptomyces lonegramiae TaxID=3075524 RepID=A0ABU2XRA5_9ACTN|nr:MarR family transcriptional regulator [Streptomyces sp. DSM 41529]MDT0548450.1 MarR family transcriptional regulator [Streptomyces sp. DSM 41529]